MDSSKNSTRDKYFNDLFHEAEKCLEAGRDAAAVELLAACYRNDPNNINILMSYGEALSSIGRLKDSEKILLKVLELSTEKYRFTANVCLGILYNKYGMYAKAESYFKNAISISDQVGWVLLLNGANSAHLCKFDDAYTSYQTALQCDDVDKDELCLNLGYLYRLQGKYDDALKAFHKALSINPQYVEAREALKSIEGVQDAIKKASDIPEDT